jgi:hypothetical protein
MKKTTTAATVAAFTVALFSVSVVPSSHAEEELPVAGSANAAEDSDLGDSTVDVNRIQASEEGGYVTLTYTIHNESDGEIRESLFTNDIYLYEAARGNTGVLLVDETNGVQYNPASDSTGQCMCAINTAASNMARRLASGDSATYWASYLISEETTSVSVEVPGFEPVTDIAVE